MGKERAHLAVELPRGDRAEDMRGLPRAAGRPELWGLGQSSHSFPPEPRGRGPQERVHTAHQQRAEGSGCKTSKWASRRLACLRRLGLEVEAASAVAWGRSLVSSGASGGLKCG